MKVGRFSLKEGEELFKITFDNEDIHESGNGVMHIDIWGGKLRALKQILNGKRNGNHNYRNKYKSRDLNENSLRS